MPSLRYDEDVKKLLSLNPRAPTKKLAEDFIICGNVLFGRKVRSDGIEVRREQERPRCPPTLMRWVSLAMVFLKLRLFDKFIGKGGKGGQKFPRLGKSRNDRLKRRM